MLVLRAVVFGILGVVFGSFLTVAVHRIPLGESVVRPRSRCSSCGTQLRAVDNIPLLSWLFLRGRCHHCGARIPVVYPLLELAGGGLFVAAALVFDPLLVAAIMAPFLAVMVALAVIDFRHRILPNRIVYPSLVVAALAIGIGGVFGEGVDVPRAAIGFAAYGGALLVVAFISPAGMGMGDVKLAGLIGLVLGSIGLAYVAVAAGSAILLGGLAALVALAFGAGRKSHLPFGPFLAAGAVIAAFFGQPIADLYLRTFT